jgi:nicotinate phosphoribosyltransferase
MKLTCIGVILKFYPKTEVTYNFTNRTPHMKFTRESVDWLKKQIASKCSFIDYNLIAYTAELDNITLTEDEFTYLKDNCPYFSQEYLEYFKSFRFNSAKEVNIEFTPEKDTGSPKDFGPIIVQVKGLWLHTILYEIPLLALISETYFKFMDTDWTHDGQVELAFTKGQKLLQGGCQFSEFGSRRRRDYHTQQLVMQGLVKAAKQGEQEGWEGKLTGTSNVHFAHKFGVGAIGTVAHEWFMGVAAVTGDYEHANEIALEYWVETFGEGVSISETEESLLTE